ncbi:DUF1120 domain-containing protein [Pseudomonas aeruginosa]
MKKQLAAFGLVTGTFLAAGSVHAAQTAEIKVIGKILPDACQLVIGGGGTYDFGSIGSDKLSQDAVTPLEGKAQTLTVTCNAAAKVALKATDNRSGSVVGGKGDGYEFGLGGTDAGSKPGFYSLRMSNAVSEGNTLDVLSDASGGGSWVTGGNLFRADSGERKSFAGSGGTLPDAFKTISADLTVTPTINKLSELDLSKGSVALDGSATIELVYL